MGCEPANVDKCIHVSSGSLYLFIRPRFSFSFEKQEEKSSKGYCVAETGSPK